MILIPWPSDGVAAIWGRVAPLLNKAISFNDGYLPEDVKEAIQDQRMQLFVVADDDNTIKGAIVTELHTYPRSRSMFLIFLGGSGYRDWPMEQLWQWGRMMKCDHATGIGRLGFDTLLPEAKTRFKYFQLDIGGGHE